jgi:hypothetical protein
VSGSTGGQRAWQGQSENSDALAAQMLSDPPLSLWAITASALITAALVAPVWLLPFGWGWGLAAGIILWVASQHLRPRFTWTQWVEEQRYRDRQAERAFQRLRAGKPTSKFLLYLRPFEITGAVRLYNQESLQKAKRGLRDTEFRSAENPQARMVEKPILAFPTLHLIGGERSNDDDNPDFEALLENGARGIAPMLALGRPGEALGTGRILLGEEEEDDWRTAIKALGARAAGFIVAPALNAGTRWELEWLKSEHSFRNCIFIMPGAQPGFDGASHWAKLRGELTSVMPLPRFAGPPALFCYDANGVAHLRTLSAQAVPRAKGPVFPVTRKQVRLALRLLAPLSAGRGEPMHLAELFTAASQAAQAAWEQEQIWRQADMHPARQNRVRVGQIAPTLPNKPSSVWWGWNGDLGVEFTPGPPLGQTPVLVHVVSMRGGYQIAGVHCQFEDADPSLSPPIEQPAQPSVQRKTMLSLEFPTKPPK